MYNRPNRRVAIVEDKRRREPQHGDAPLREPGIATRVSLSGHGAIMSLSVDLHDQAGRVTEEVRHHARSRLLPPELQASGALSKPNPKQHLRKRHLSPQPASALHGLRRPAQHYILPLEGRWRA
jgi:hypothetical protein